MPDSLERHGARPWIARLHLGQRGRRQQVGFGPTQQQRRAGQPVVALPQQRLAGPGLTDQFVQGAEQATVHRRALVKGLPVRNSTAPPVDQEVELSLSEELLRRTIMDMVPPEQMARSTAEIEKLQEEIARKLGFKLVDHRLELYGIPIKDGE